MYETILKVRLFIISNFKSPKDTNQENTMAQFNYAPNRAQESRAAIQRLYISMRHLLIRGSYKPGGVSGKALIENLMILQPEIYGSINDLEKVELNGLHYVFQRLPQGIEECQFIKLITREGFEDSAFEPIIPPKRRRQAYRIDDREMYIEMTRGRSDIYDILTHLTFMYAEGSKISRNSRDLKGRQKREWNELARIVEMEAKGQEFSKQTAYTYLSTLLGRTYDEVVEACKRFDADDQLNSLFHVTYHLGLLATNEEDDPAKDLEISFSASLREKTGHHHYGEIWAQNIKAVLLENDIIQRPIHIISANLHSVMNSLFAPAALRKKIKANDILGFAEALSQGDHRSKRETVRKMALDNGMIEIMDTSGTNISVQIFDTAKFSAGVVSKELGFASAKVPDESPVILVMDYAFGEQAYESMDELLRPYHTPEGDEVYNLRVESINVMGKAGILEGVKGDLMIPNAHVFEGTADNYPFTNDFVKADFEGHGLAVYTGPMITVLGTSLQNRDILSYFLESSWKAAGLEMEGAHYQKAIQAATHIRTSVNPDLKLRYAYYASDNPLVTGHTLASGSLGVDGVKPTYLITIRMLQRIFGGERA